MISVLLLAGAAIVGAAAVAVFWKDIAAWLSRVWEKLPHNIKENLQGAKAFIENVASKIKNIWYYYSYNRDTQKWTETVVSKEVSESEIPQDILEKMRRSNKVDITSEAEKQLELMN